MMDRRETMRRRLLRGAINGTVDLGSRRSVGGYLSSCGHTRAQIAALTEADIEVVRRKLKPRAARLQDWFDDALDRVEESGFGPLLILAGLGLLALCAWHLLRSPAHASTLQAMGARHATAIGTVLTLLPIGIAVVLMAAALRAAVAPAAADPRSADEERLR